MGIDTLRCDTLALVPRLTYAKRAKQQAEELEKWEKQRERRHRRGNYSDEVPPREFLKVEIRGASGTLAPNENPSIILPVPAASIDRNAIHLLLGPDSLQTEARYELIPLPNSRLGYKLIGEWRPGQQYTLKIDSAAIWSIYGIENKALTQRFRISSNDEFGSVFVTLLGVDTTAMVQLILDDNRVIQTTRVGNDGQASFFYIRPGKAYMRLFIDVNGNGVWDTGDYDAHLQPEQMYYYPKQIELRAGWDTEITWQPDELPVLRQKPEALRSNSSTSTRQRGAHERNLERQKERRR